MTSLISVFRCSDTETARLTCVCANRILVQDGVYDAFTKRLAQTAGAMPANPKTRKCHGPKPAKRQSGQAIAIPAREPAVPGATGA